MIEGVFPFEIPLFCCLAPVVPPHDTRRGGYYPTVARVRLYSTSVNYTPKFVILSLSKNLK